jgi:glycosyltransferase involved in cell wall biosynthesis
MSRQAMEQLADAGAARYKLYFVNPAHDEVIRPRPLTMGIAPRFSIGIAFFNPGAHFREALASVFAQTRSDWELILVDDGSTDGSLEIAQSLSDPRVRVVHDGLRRGFNIRLNQISSLATGDFVVRMDADDIMFRARLETLDVALRAAGENTVVGSAAISIDEHSRIVGLRRVPERVRGYTREAPVIHPTVAVRRDWFLRNPYSEDPVFHRAQDTELWMRVAHRTTFVNVQQPLLFYRESSQYRIDVHFANVAATIAAMERNIDEPRWRKRIRALNTVLRSAVIVGFDLIGSRYFARRVQRPLTQEERQAAEAELRSVLASAGADSGATETEKVASKR